MHRDLKLQNILLRNQTPLEETQYDIVVIDWGCARHIAPSERLQELVGTPLYMAPEQINGNYNEKVDVWQIGVIMYIMLSGTTPFQGNSVEEVMKAVIRGNWQMDGELWDKITDDAKDLIRGMLRRDLDGRLSAREALEHRWFAAAPDKLPDTALVMKYVQNISKFDCEEKIRNGILAYIACRLVIDSEKIEQERVFKAMDRSKNGSISKAELEEYLVNNRMTERKEKEQQMLADNDNSLFKRMDSNVSGEINFMEFITATSNKEVYENE